MCQLCNAKPVYEFTNKRKVCKNCYIKWFNKKALYTIRKFSMIKKDDVIKLSKKKDFRNAVLTEILKNYSNKYYAEITFNEKKKHNKSATAETIDLIAKIIIKEIIMGDVNKLKRIYPVYENQIRPLFLFLDKEVLLYANLKNLKFSSIKKTKEDKLSLFVEGLEKKHPEVKRAIVKGFLGLNESL